MMTGNTLDTKQPFCPTHSLLFHHSYSVLLDNLSDRDFTFFNNNNLEAVKQNTFPLKN